MTHRPFHELGQPLPLGEGVLVKEADPVEHLVHHEVDVGERVAGEPLRARGGAEEALVRREHRRQMPGAEVAFDLLLKCQQKVVSNLTDYTALKNTAEKINLFVS